LKSFRSSPWDPKESLPQNYSYIYQLNNFSLLQKVECTRMEMLSRELEKKQLNSIEQKKQKNKKGNQKKNNDDDEDVSMNTNSFSISEARQDTLKELDDSANPGTYVTLVLADVEEAVLSSYPAHSPLVLSTLMAHENKMSVMHFLVQKSTATCDDTIQSKDNLDICCGFRRTINSRPIFSQHNFNSDKHKYERFLMPGRFTCASAYYPITYGQPPTLIMKTLENGKKQLVASG
jgi:pre-rRNA-processing protein TSR1